MGQQNGLRRFLVFREATARQYLCICAARDSKHALKIARQNFRLARTAVAIPEISEQRSFLF